MLDIVIVSWNSGDTLTDCIDNIERVAELDDVDVTIAIVDNGSKCPPPARAGTRIILNDSNRGFAEACNQGAAATSSPFILFLNPDVMLREDTLRLTISALGGDEEKVIGIQLRDQYGSIQRTCAKRPTVVRLCVRSLGIDRTRLGQRLGPLMSKLDYTKDARVDQVIGAFFGTTRSLFNRLNGFDTRFFVYYEEVDYCIRAALLGASIEHLGSCHAVHLGGTSSIKAGPRRYAYASMSRYLYARKHLGAAGAALVGASSLVIEPVWRSLQKLARGDVKVAWLTVRSYVQWFMAQRNGRRGAA